ncbi:MAG: type II toxin-antitoxin system HicA family toxin, partial [Verrucomicrobiota bacterium]
MPRKIRQLIKDLKKAGFTEVRGGGKGDHRKFGHPNVSRPAVLDGRDGDDA